MFPYVLPQVQTPEEIETETKLVDDKFIDLRTKFDEVNDVVIELKKQQKNSNSIKKKSISKLRSRRHLDRR